MLPIDDRLRAVARGQFSRLAQYEIEVENPLRPKEIQARIRAGETVEEIADAAGIPVERVRWFEGPVLAERGYVAQQAQTASVRRQGDSTPGPRLGEVVAERLTDLGADPEDAQWDSRKHGDGSWQVQLAFRAGGRLHIAEWLFDPRRRHVVPADDNANRLSLPEAELPPPTGGSLGAATVTPIRPRPDRSQPVPPHEPVMEPAEEPARAAAHAAASASFAAPRPPIGRPPSHATPQTGSPRMPVSDDEPNGTGRGPAHRAGGTGRPAPGQGTGDRNAAPAATAGNPATPDRAAPDRAAPDRAGRPADRAAPTGRVGLAAQPITGRQAAAAQPAAAQAGPEARTASAPQGRGSGIDTDRDRDTDAVAASAAGRSARPERAAAGQAAAGQGATGQGAQDRAARDTSARDAPATRNRPPRNRSARTGPLRNALVRDGPTRNWPLRRRPPRARRRLPRPAGRPTRPPAVRTTPARRPQPSPRPTRARTKPQPAGGARRPRARAADVPPSPPGMRSCSAIPASPTRAGATGRVLGKYCPPKTLPVSRGTRRAHRIGQRKPFGFPGRRGPGGNRRARVTGA